MNDERTERVIQMESFLNESYEAIRRLSDAMDGYEAVQEKLDILENYYTGNDWMADYQADERGEFPEGLERGVLSEDAVYDLLTEHRELMKRLLKAVLMSL